MLQDLSPGADQKPSAQCGKVFRITGLTNNWTDSVRISQTFSVSGHLQVVCFLTLYTHSIILPCLQTLLEIIFQK